MGMASELRGVAMKADPKFNDTADNLMKFFIERVRSNLHVALCIFSRVCQIRREGLVASIDVIAGCTIDWFLPGPRRPWLPCQTATFPRSSLIAPKRCAKSLSYMGIVHGIVVNACDEYFVKMRRHVYQTPKSFLQFLSDYSGMYTKKCTDIDVKAKNVIIGLEKLAAGAKDVEKMKIVLAQEEVKLRESEAATNAMLGKLEVSSMEAKKEADIVSKIKKEACQIDAERIAGEKSDAEEDLAKAQPFVDAAESAVNSIKPNDLNELKKLSKPSDIIKLIFDVVAILRMQPLVKQIEPQDVTLGVGKDKKTFTFIKDSFAIAQKGMLVDARFLQLIMNFSKVEKDFINDETIEFMAPYLKLEGFSALAAKNASKAAEGLCLWCRAMADYHEASKIVKPKLEALRVAEARLQDAERELFKAESRLKACQEVLGNLQRDFDAQLATKRKIEENAMRTESAWNKQHLLLTA